MRHSNTVNQTFMLPSYISNDDVAAILDLETVMTLCR